VFTVRALKLICGALTGSADVVVTEVVTTVGLSDSVCILTGAAAAASGIAALAATAPAAPAAAVSKARRERGALGSDAISVPSNSMAKGTSPRLIGIVA
jgi:hypothetical protein